MPSQKEIEAANKLSLWDTIKMGLVLLPAPLTLIWALIKKPFSSFGRAKTWKMALFNQLLVTTTGLNRKQLRVFFGPTRSVYNTFIKGTKLPSTVEELGEDAKLLWIGPKRTDKVILYLHGGAFLFCAAAPDYWRFIQENLAERGQDVGCVMLEYALVPDKTFPSQLIQGVLAVQHILGSGVEPHNLVLVGDSAGGMLIHQILSHMLHPVEGVPELKLIGPGPHRKHNRPVSLGGAYLLSPWSQLRNVDGCLSKLDHQGDFLTGNVLGTWGDIVMKDVPASGIPYLEPNSAPKDWYVGLDKCVQSILVSAGGVECLRDEIVKHYETLKRHHRDVTFYLQANGVHDGPYWDIATGDRRVVDLTAKVLNWLHTVYSD